MDWFVTATSKILHGMKDKLQEGPTTRESWQELWNDAQDSIDLLSSVGKGIQDIVKSSINDVGSMVLNQT